MAMDLRDYPLTLPPAPPASSYKTLYTMKFASGLRAMPVPRCPAVPASPSRRSVRDFGFRSFPVLDLHIAAFTVAHSDPVHLRRALKAKAPGPGASLSESTKVQRQMGRPSHDSNDPLTRRPGTPTASLSSLLTCWSRCCLAAARFAA
jgi:hypothetical protein